MVENKTMKTDWFPGDVCAYVKPYSEKIKVGYVQSVTGQRAIVKAMDEPGTTVLEYSQMFVNRDDALDAIEKLNAEKVADYKGEINDVNDLVVFAYTHNITTDNPQARKAYRERVQELLSLNLDI